MTDPGDLTARVTELEVQLAHLSRLHDQLNEVITEQALEADRQQRTIERLIAQVRELKQRPLPEDDPFDEKPPHY